MRYLAGLTQEVALCPNQFKAIVPAESGAEALKVEPGNRAQRRGFIPAWILTEELTAWTPI